MAELTQFIDTAARVAAAQLSLDAANERHQEVLTTARDARTREGEALDKLNAETQLLAQAERDHHDAVVTGASIAKHDAVIRKLKDNVESHSRVYNALKQNADTVDANIIKSSHSITEALKQLDEAIFDDLLQRYSRAIVSAIPIAREIRMRASSRGFNTQLSGYLIDPSRPTLGLLNVRDDGTLFLAPRFSI